MLKLKEGRESCQRKTLKYNVPHFTIPIFTMKYDNFYESHFSISKTLYQIPSTNFKFTYVHASLLLLLYIDEEEMTTLCILHIHFYLNFTLFGTGESISTNTFISSLLRVSESFTGFSFITKDSVNVCHSHILYLQNRLYYLFPLLLCIVFICI